jgi:hypothetical protein
MFSKTWRVRGACVGIYHPRMDEAEEERDEEQYAREQMESEALET